MTMLEAPEQLERDGIRPQDPADVPVGDPPFLK